MPDDVDEASIDEAPQPQVPQQPSSERNQESERGLTFKAQPEQQSKTARNEPPQTMQPRPQEFE